MRPEPDTGQDFDLAAAGLRADGAEFGVWVQALASKLESALPARTRVERRGGGLLGRGEQRVKRLNVALGGSRFSLELDGERVRCSRQREVGGISIKAEQLDPDAWVTALTGELRAEAERSADARVALEGLLR